MSFPQSQAAMEEEQVNGKGQASQSASRPPGVEPASVPTPQPSIMILAMCSQMPHTCPQPASLGMLVIPAPPVSH